MRATTDALWIAVAALAVAALALTAVGRRQRRYRGWPYWVAALWLATAAAAWGAIGGDRPGASWAVQMLLLPWPVLTLVGLRRFQSRGDWPGSERGDGTALLLALTATAAGALTPTDSVARGLVPEAASVALYLYVAGVLCSLPPRDGLPSPLLGVAVAVVGVLPPMMAWPGTELQPAATLRVLAAAPAALVTAFAMLLMVGERSERELLESQRRLRALADLDALTRVPNRRRFEELARRAQREDQGYGAVMVMFDIDHFKRINDRLGHAAGDRALCLVASCVQEHLRAQDVAGRLGGDEFALLLRSASVEAALSVSDRIVTGVQQRAGAQGLPLFGLSFGIVEWRPHETMADALQRADQALYEAKRQGRSCAVAASGHGERPQFSESQRLGLTAS